MADRFFDDKDQKDFARVDSIFDSTGLKALLRRGLQKPMNGGMERDGG